MVVGSQLNQQCLPLRSISFLHLMVLPPKPKPTKRVKMPCSFFPLLPTQNSTFAGLAAVLQLAGGKREFFPLSHQSALDPRFVLEPSSIR